MGTTHTFKGASSLQLGYTFDGDTLAGNRENTMHFLGAVAREAGFEMRATWSGDTVIFEFRDPGELLVMQDVLHSLSAVNGQHVHNHTFDNEGMQAAWVHAATTMLEESGIPHKLVQRPGEVGICFESSAAMMIFQNTAQTGYFDKAAIAYLRIPDPMKLIPNAG